MPITVFMVMYNSFPVNKFLTTLQSVCLHCSKNIHYNYDFTIKIFIIAYVTLMFEQFDRS